MRATLAVFKSTVGVHLKNTLARPMFQVVLVVQPFVVATTTYMLYRQSQVADLAEFVILGGGLAGIWSALTFSSAGDIHRERFYGTLQPMLASPSRLLLLFSAKISANALLSLLALLLSFVYGRFLLRVAVAFPHPLAFVAALLAFLFAANAYALCLSTIFLLSRSTLVMQNFLEYPLLLLGGLAFPVSVLPRWAQALSQALPLRWGAEALRLTLGAAPLEEAFWSSLIWTLVCGGLYFGLAGWLFKRVERRVRRDASLDLA